MSSEERVDVALEGSRAVARCHGEEVGRIHVPRVELQWCEETFVTMGGIAGVGTDAKFRRRGVAGRMMAQAVQHFRENAWVCGGVSTSALNVARRLYSRAGFEYVFSMMGYVREPREDAPAPATEVEIRGYEDGDVATILELHRKEYGRFFGQRKPDAAKWLTYRQQTIDDDRESVLLAIRDGEPVGYASYFKHWFRIACEFCVPECPDRTEVARALLRVLETRLAAKECEVAPFSTTEDETFLRGLLESEGYRPDDGRVFKVNILSLEGLLRQLQVSFERRISASSVPEWAGTLEARTEDDCGRAEIGEEPGSGCLAISASRPVLTQVLCGAMSGWEAYLKGLLDVSTRADGDAEEVLKALLPRVPYCHPMDEWW